MQKLDNYQINNELNKLKGWDYENNSIHKNYVLSDFANALAFTLKVGILAEKADHHPDLLIHKWNNVKITISTHSEGGVTDNDFNLAQQIEKIIL